jgi:hypothetical protein
MIDRNIRIQIILYDPDGNEVARHTVSDPYVVQNISLARPAVIAHFGIINSGKVTYAEDIRPVHLGSTDSISFSSVAGLLK